MEFELQTKRVGGRVWHVPDRRGLWSDYTLRSNYVSSLRRTIGAIADAQTLAFTLHWRIVTKGGDPVERWKTKPGRAKRTRRKQ